MNESNSIATTDRINLTNQTKFRLSEIRKILTEKLIKKIMQ